MYSSAPDCYEKGTREIRLGSKYISEEADWTQECKKEFGRSSEVVDWGEITSDVRTRSMARKMLGRIGILQSEEEMHYFLTYQNEKWKSKSWDSDRAYVIEYPPRTIDVIKASHFGLNLGSGRYKIGQVLCLTELDKTDKIRLSSKSVGEMANWKQVCTDEFGDKSYVVDWTNDLLRVYDKRDKIQELLDKLGVVNSGGVYFVTHNDEKWDAQQVGRHAFYMSYNPGTLRDIYASYFGVNLGSKKNILGKVLCQAGPGLSGMRLSSRYVGRKANWTKVCRDEFGKDARVVDWQKNFVGVMTIAGNSLFDRLGIKSTRTVKGVEKPEYYFLTYKDEKWDTTRGGTGLPEQAGEAFYMEYPEGSPYGSHIVSNTKGMYVGYGKHLGGEVLCWAESNYPEVKVITYILMMLAALRSFSSLISFGSYPMLLPYSIFIL